MTSIMNKTILKPQVLYNQSIRQWIRSGIQAITWWYHHQ